MPNFKNKNAPPGPRVPRREAFPIREATLANELHISVDQLRGRRMAFLLYGHHWEYVKKRVAYSTLGAVILRGTIRAALPNLTPPDAPPADCEPKNRPVAGLLLEKNPVPAFKGQLIAWATPLHNPKLLICYLPETDPSNPLNLVRCFVRSNVNFLRGMTLPGPGRNVLSVGDDLYELSGACPRYRGRW